VSIASSPHAATHGATHPQAGPRTYLVIAAFLLLLTVMEVAVFYIPALARVLVPVLVFLALAKFALVAMFYMHLRFDHIWFSYLFVGPLIVAVLLVISLLWLFGHIGTTGIRPAAP
jgi:heme/copper-type cytochrome/quinol oxidase subunit 4